MAMERKVLSPEEREQKKRMNRWLKLRTSASELKMALVKLLNVGSKLRQYLPQLLITRKRRNRL